jgi:hypothetical protein
MTSLNLYPTPSKSFLVMAIKNLSFGVFKKDL